MTAKSRLNRLYDKVGALCWEYARPDDFKTALMIAPRVRAGDAAAAEQSLTIAGDGYKRAILAHHLSRSGVFSDALRETIAKLDTAEIERINALFSRMNNPHTPEAEAEQIVTELIEVIDQWELSKPD